MDNGDIVEVKLYSSHTNQLGINVLHYVVADKIGLGATALQCADAATSAFASAMKALLSSEARFEGATAQVIYPVKLDSEASTGGAGAGAAGAQSLPTQTCGILTKVTGIAGRKFRGRMYVPFPCEGDNGEDGIPEATYTGHMGDLGDAMLGALLAGTGGVNSVNLVPIIYHRATHTFNYLVGYIVRPKWGTQRRRGAYGAANVLPF